MSGVTLRIRLGEGSSLGDLIDGLAHDLPDLSGAINLAADLIPLKNAKITEGTLGFATDAKRGFSLSDAKIVGRLSLGDRIAIGLTVEVADGNLSTPSIALEWPPPGESATPLHVSDLLAELGAPFELPGALDIEIDSLAFAYESIDQNARLPGNQADTHRLVLTSPKDVSPAALLVCWSFDSQGKRRTVMRAERNSLSLDALPVIGSHLPARLEPLILLLLTQDLPLSELAVLARLSECPGLETLGVPADKQAEPIPAGIHCAGIFDVTVNQDKLVHLPFYFPLYRFAAPAPAATARLAAFADSPGLAEANKTTSVTAQKNIGPVHLNSIGFRFENGAISVLLDAGIKTGGFDLELVGLKIGFNLHDVRPVIDIDGLTISYQASSFSIEGGLVRRKGAEDTDWIGTALVDVAGKFAVAAIGAFNEGEPKKMFLFGYDHQQLGGPPWFIITGLALGFGYNRAFKLPTVDKVDDFPFIKIANDLSRGTSPPTTDPWALMDSLVAAGFLDAADGTDFVTVGVTGTSFGLADSTVLLTIIFGSSIEFVILGSSSISVPKDAPIAHAEVELVASVQPDAGLVPIDGLLAPGSYVLSSSCALTGGFAYHVWFTGEHAGDFVLSFGGYGPFYNRPAHYPAVPRLGFTWHLSDEILVSGWSYFALTPSSVQAGGSLQITLDAGPLSVWCHAQADFFLSWMPFHYDISLSVDFGITFRLDLVLFTITISIDISADLEIWGPDFSGHAEIHLWFVSFGIGFGADAGRDPPKVAWEDFAKSLIVPDPKAAVAGAASHVAMVALDQPALLPNPLAQQPVQIVAVAGLRAPPDGSSADWLADPAHAVFNVVTKLPAAHASLAEEPNGTATGVPLRDGSLPALTVKAVPLEGSPTINPTLAVTITASDSWTPEAIPGQVSGALWGNEPSKGPELVPALTGVRVSIVPKAPHQTQWIDQAILLVDTHKVPVTDSPPERVAPGTFDWDRNGPFATMQDGAVRSQLAGMVADGYLAQAAVDAIDLFFVQPGEPCFMARPMLCRLGAEQLS
jgi:hypothetical protein